MGIYRQGAWAQATLGNDDYALRVLAIRPVDDAKDAMNPVTAPPTQRPIIRVLIADDAPETRRSMQLILSLAPDAEVVATARNGREAVEMAVSHQPDVALVDVNMPEMNGLEAIRRMRARRPELVCIIVSAEKDAVTLKQAVEVGVAAYLIKPFTAEQVLGILEKSRQLAVAARVQAAAAHPTQPSRREWLEQTANAFVKARRTDDAAVKVFEALAAMPDCSLRWLTHLAIIYALRGEWNKLKRLATHLEQRQK
ncbi:MAG: Stage 0 sporulation protein A [Chloroflexi bacterium ADurb.Bin360]|nr:MAG: Stage 0 sporulation protein A [Chloroflexi bacterium ADurb.Bin360]